MTELGRLADDMTSDVLVALVANVLDIPNVKTAAAILREEWRRRES
jgi:hypothetical protein